MKILYLTIILTIAFNGVVYAKQVSVDVVTPQDQKTLKAEVVNITPDTVIDLTTPFSATEKANVKAGLTLSAKESEVLDKMLGKQQLKGMSEGIARNSVFKKLYFEKALSQEEVKYIWGMDGRKKTIGNMVVYLSRKKIKEDL